MARSIIVIMITIIALIIPNFTDFLNLVGAVSGGMLAFIMPPLLYNIEFKNEISKTKRLFNRAIFTFGIVGSIFSIWTSVDSIRNNLKH